MAQTESKIPYEDIVKKYNELCERIIQLEMDKKNLADQLTWRSVENDPPKEFEYVQVLIPNNNVYGYKNKQMNIDIGCLVRGISQEEREELPSDSGRKLVYKSEDEWSNNEKPYCWACNMRKMFGQEITHWMPMAKEIV